MSAETDMSTNTIEVFIPLLNEGTEVLRPTMGVALDSNSVKVLAATDYDPNTEEWEFPPGTEVGCIWEIRDGRRILVARQRLS